MTSPEEYVWHEQEVNDTRAAMRNALDTMEKAAVIFATGATRLDDGGPGSGTLYDTAWAEGPGARLGTRYLNDLDKALFGLRACLDHGQPTGPTA